VNPESNFVTDIVVFLVKVKLCSCLECWHHRHLSWYSVLNFFTR